MDDASNNNNNKRARTSVDKALVDVWLRELGQLSTRNFALRRRASEVLFSFKDILIPLFLSKKKNLEWKSNSFYNYILFWVI